MKRNTSRLSVGLAALLAAAAFVPGLPAAETAYLGDPVPADFDAVFVRGLAWLAKTQTEDGTWEDARQNDGIAALALLAMLAHGDDPNAGPWSMHVRRTIHFILSRQNAGNGYIGSSMYNHGFCTLALAEAYGHVEDTRIGPALRRAVELILSSQARNPLKAWRYTPESQDADTTVSGAQMVALFAARNAGITVPDSAIEDGVAYYRRSQNGDGGFAYSNEGGGRDVSPARSAIGALVFGLARDKQTRNLKAAFNGLTSASADAGNDTHLFYYLYYAAQAYFQASPPDWREWNAANFRRLAATQAEDGGWSGDQGRTFSTACALLSMGVSYRFLPIYER